jgi:hypothetical protein
MSTSKGADTRLARGYSVFGKQYFASISLNASTGQKAAGLLARRSLLEL